MFHGRFYIIDFVAGNGKDGGGGGSLWSGKRGLGKYREQGVLNSIRKNVKTLRLSLKHFFNIYYYSLAYCAFLADNNT